MCRALQRSRFSTKPKVCSMTWRSTAGRHRNCVLLEFARNYEILGDTGKQLARAKEAHRLLAELSAQKPDDVMYQSGLATTFGEVGDVLVEQGDLTEALKSYRDSLTIRERLAKAEADLRPAR